MKSPTRCLGLAAVAAFILASNPVLAQKSGGVLKIQHMDTPPSASIHEEATFSAVMPFMALYNNLVIFDQHVAQQQPRIDRARSRHELDVERRRQSGSASNLRQGVKWHDGKPFTAKDVACTFDLLIEPRQAAAQPALCLVGQPREGDGRERLRRHLPSQAPPALAAGACSRRATRRSIPAMFRPRTCGASRSAPARSSSPSSR